MDNKRDLTYHHRINKRNTFNTIFPVYTPKVKDFMSSTQSSFTNSLNYEKDSEFETHNKDLINKSFNKKVDRIVQYTESMLKIKNMIKLNRK
jgi:hypothetical protein